MVNAKIIIMYPGKKHLGFFLNKVTIRLLKSGFAEYTPHGSLLRVVCNFSLIN